ncbi:L-threonylcarbamoyladenylate synthase [Alcanivorax sp. 1008]|uniref:L-threonylcarbamoyladenylate synthase n=1 Tax=Alcanivorax sp. 1008 TaxID=2816853 RepID=UPI001DBC15E3|nr:L-threonylcarbamoyladenylate synthase [Alcanivorax sp. 1008]MCC1495682.1 threonylcarbamoyl-AMP synthase [Alcanivorax sp. 1008]
MTTRHLDARNPEQRQQAITLLASGAVVAVPTETVYGLAADASNPAAIARIFSAKGRPSGHPLIVHIHDAGQLPRWANSIPEQAWRVAEKFWPGPLTLILPRHASVSPAITGGLGSVALRVPGHRVLRDILKTLDTGLAAPSANPYQGLSPTRAEHVLAGLAGRIDAVLDDGPCEVGLESTILDLTGDTPRLVRPGPITREALEVVLQQSIENDSGQTAAPGNELIHYRPRTRACRVSGEKIAATLAWCQQQGLQAGVISYSDLSPELDRLPALYQLICLPADKAGYARQLYHAMHELDGTQADIILVQTPPIESEWSDVMNRLQKATDLLSSIT